jgi:3-phosphoshikimate 1-carboxyvinyltransferase
MITVNKIKNKDAVFTAPPSKAHTLRALIISSLADGKSIIRNPLLAEDQINTINALSGLGIKITQDENTITVHGNSGLYEPLAEELNIGESGVGMNFLTSAACLSAKPVILTGSKRIRERPIAEVVKGLRQLGCEIGYLENKDYPPIRITSHGIQGGEAKISGMKTSQYFSSLIISCPYADKDVNLICTDKMSERPYFDITQKMMEEFGIKIENDNYRNIHITGRQCYKAGDITIEGDYSSASFFLTAAAICKSKITVNGLTSGTKQGDKAILDILSKMGCEISEGSNSICLEGTALNSIEIDMSDIPDLVPPVAIACSFAKGISHIKNIGQLRIKECDRISVLESELTKMGVNIKASKDSIHIEGNSRNIKGALINPHNDHRIAMSFAVAGLIAGNQQIENEKCVAKSFPDFWEKLKIFYN